MGACGAGLSVVCFPREPVQSGWPVTATKIATGTSNMTAINVRYRAGSLRAALRVGLELSNEDVSELKTLVVSFELPEVFQLAS